MEGFENRSIDMVKKLILCKQCYQVIPLLEDIVDFGDSSLLFGVEWSSEDMDKQKEFYLCHGNHNLEELIVDSKTFVSDKPSYEPVKTSYFEAGNGQEKLLIRRTRERLNQPAQYEIVPGQLQISNISANIQDNELRKEISGRDGYLSLPEEKVEKFIRALTEEVENISPEKLTEEMEVTQEGETPLLAYGILKEVHWKNVLRKCQNDFQKNDLTYIKKFIRKNKEPGDVLALQIHRKINLLPQNLEQTG
jgi:hypothetical protein